MNRVYNFSAGPSMLPVPVLQKAQADLLDYHGSGMSVMEMSHRSKWFDEIIQNTEAGIRKVLNVPDNYKIGFFQGGATQQFAMVPLNFMTTGTADYLVTGNFSKKAAEEAAKFGTARIAASNCPISTGLNRIGHGDIASSSCRFNVALISFNRISIGFNSVIRWMGSVDSEMIFSIP